MTHNPSDKVVKKRRGWKGRFIPILSTLIEGTIEGETGEIEDCIQEMVRESLQEVIHDVIENSRERFYIKARKDKIELKKVQAQAHFPPSTAESQMKRAKEHDNFVGDAVFYKINDRKLVPKVEGVYNLMYRRQLGTPFATIFTPSCTNFITVIPTEESSPFNSKIIAHIALTYEGQSVTMAVEEIATGGSISYQSNLLMKNNRVCGKNGRSDGPPMNINEDDRLDSIFCHGKGVILKAGSTISFGVKDTEVVVDELEQDFITKGFYFLKMELAIQDNDTGELERHLLVAVRGGEHSKSTTRLEERITDSSDLLCLELGKKDSDGQDALEDDQIKEVSKRAVKIDNVLRYYSGDALLGADSDFADDHQDEMGFSLTAFEPEKYETLVAGQTIDAQIGMTESMLIFLEEMDDRLKGAAWSKARQYYQHRLQIFKFERALKRGQRGQLIVRSQIQQLREEKKVQRLRGDFE